MGMTTREFLSWATLPREVVDRFLDSKAANWSSFDPVLGYRLKDSVLRYGIEETYAIFSYQQSGARRMVNFPYRHCRINTYGNSFTQEC